MQVKPADNSEVIINVRKRAFPQLIKLRRPVTQSDPAKLRRGLEELSLTCAASIRHVRPQLL